MVGYNGEIVVRYYEGLTVADHRADAIGWEVAAQMHPRVVGRRADVVLILGELVVLRQAKGAMVTEN